MNNKYKKHDFFDDLWSVPKEILKIYSNVCEYKYLIVDGFGAIPFQKFALAGVENNKLNIFDLPIDKYASGFIEGYNSDLKPFIDTNETRIEIILTETSRGIVGFTESIGGKVPIEYKKEAMYESGLYEGKRYKAWEIVFQTPSVFEEVIKRNSDKIREQQTAEEMKEALINTHARSYIVDLLNDLDKIFSDTSVSTLERIRLIENRLDEFERIQKTISNGIAVVNYKDGTLSLAEPDISEVIELCKKYIHRLEREFSHTEVVEDFSELVEKINNAFYRLESYMSGTLMDYQYFGFNDIFTILFNEGKKPKNYTPDNCGLIGKYWQLTEQIRIDYDKANFDNTDAYDNESFITDCNEIEHLSWERIDEFTEFSAPDKVKETESRFSIMNIINPSKTRNQPIETKEHKKEVFEFLNNFDTVDTSKIYDHFKVNLVDKKLLSEKVLKLYLVAAFQEKKPPTKLFNFENNMIKKDITHIFYQYYISAGKPYGRQKEYAGLLGEYFIGYKTKNVSTNFGKENY